MRRVLSLLGVVAILLLVACQPLPPGPVGPGGTAPVQSDDFPGGEGRVALLTDVRATGHPGFDRVVLEFEGEDVPSYRVMYVSPPIEEDASGMPIAVSGGAFLELRVTPASGVDLSGPEVRETYDGPDRFTVPGAANITEIVRTGDFEANLGWVVGLDRERPFSVTFLQDPLRLVVDIFDDPTEPPPTEPPVGPEPVPAPPDFTG